MISILDQVIDWEDEADVIGGLVLIGVVGIEDPVRPEGMTFYYFVEKIKLCLVLSPQIIYWAQS